MISKKYFLFIFVLYFVMAVPALAMASSSKASHKAVGLMKQGRDNDALKVYDEALQAQPEDLLLNFNAGAAYYKGGQFEKARELYQKLLSSGNRRLEEASAYNMGNTYLRESESSEGNEGELLQKALSYYRQALLLNSRDKDAKYNYELTQKKIEQLKPRSSSSSREQKSSSGQSGQGQDESAQNQEEKEQPQDQQPEQEQNQEQKQPFSQQPEQQEKQSERIQPQGGPAEPMTKDEARAMLQDYGKDQLRLVPEENRKARQREVEKDW